MSLWFAGVRHAAVHVIRPCFVLCAPRCASPRLHCGTTGSVDSARARGPPPAPGDRPRAVRSGGSGTRGELLSLPASCAWL